MLKKNGMTMGWGMTAVLATALAGTGAAAQSGLAANEHPLWPGQAPYAEGSALRMCRR